MLEKSVFFNKYRIEESEFEEAGLDWDDLLEIHADHTQRYSDLEATGNDIASRLRQVPSVHSLKIRVKHPEHLLEKIIRKRLEDESREISCSNYRREITDLIGVRALHLFKGEWEPIHEYIYHTWELHEDPIAYVRRGDSDILRTGFEEKGCQVIEHKAYYRSLHYLVKCSPTKEQHIAEVQVRTIFEEGWSEIDHQVRYPYEVGDPLLSQFLVIFNRLAGSADEMGSFVRQLKEELAIASAERERLRKELNDKIEQLEIEKAEKEELSRRVDELTEQHPTSGPIKIGLDHDFSADPVFVPGNRRLGEAWSQRDWGGRDIYGEVPLGRALRDISIRRMCSRCGDSYEDTSLIQVEVPVCPDCRDSSEETGES